MKIGAGALFVAIGLLLLWAAVTGRLANLENAWATLRGQKPTTTPAPNTTAPASRIATSRTLNVPVEFPITPTFPYEAGYHSNLGRQVN